MGENQVLENNLLFININNLFFYLQAPIDHKLMLSVPSKSETLGILSRFTNDEDVEVRSIEGSIVQNAVCRPVAMGSRYNNLKKASFQKAERKDRKTIFMQEPVNTCLPRNFGSKNLYRYAKIYLLIRNNFMFFPKFYPI